MSNHEEYVNRIPEGNDKNESMINKITKNYMKIDLNDYVNKETFNKATFYEETFKEAIKDCDVFVVKNNEMENIGKYKEMEIKYYAFPNQSEGNNTVKETYVIFEDDSKSETEITVMTCDLDDGKIIGKSPDPLYILKADCDKNSTKTVGGKLKRSRKNKNTNKKSKNTRRKSIRRRRH
jgi:hypothetical protein